MSVWYIYLATTDNGYKVFPGVIIRICQFHIIQAICRWERDRLGEENKKAVKTGKRGRAKHIQENLRISDEALSELLDAFRSTQRCRGT